MTIFEELKERILILDGAMGTMLQKGLSEEDTLKAYVEAGADIITTNSFGANRISQTEYGLQGQASRMAFGAAVTARRVADSAGRKVYVAGSAGPTGKSLTLVSDASDPAWRQYSYEAFVGSYLEQFKALLAGGADLILLETFFDALNAKAAISAVSQLDRQVPVIISATVSDRSGRTLTGQTLEAFYRAVEHCPNLLAFGINCALGAEMMAPLVEEISSFCNHAVSFYPNAGIPDELGHYNDSPALMASVAGKLAQEGKVNIVGGCCGSTPEHISALAAAVKGLPPRAYSPANILTVSGLEAVPIDRSRNFANIGERTNVAGSRKFAKLIAGDNYAEALSIAVAQIEGGADIIDINMDDPMVDSSQKMRVFLRHIAGEPDIARAAVMIDSSHWDTILEGLKNVQGKCMVNSISLKEGEEEFLRKALIIRSMGAAMVVMAFDEEGQAVTFDRKIEICRRSYRLLTEAGIPPHDIIFDANILSIGTGIPEHSRFGVDFIEAVRWIKENLPGALTSGGVSNLSFAFRGNNPVREAMHSVFLYHAIKAGLDMAIVNPQMLQIHDDIDPSLRKAVEDVIFDSDPEATARLVAIASLTLPGSGTEERRDGTSAEIRKDVRERLSEAVVKGSSAGITEDTLECMHLLGSAVAVIEGPLMSGMERVGELFADGRMFLPQVVKSARTMREAVSVLQPFIDSEESSPDRPEFLIATVQGDVHDIGKNITSIVLGCSGFNVTDLGVMVPCRDILENAASTGADIIGVSGLITPSLHRMEEICREMSARGMNTPLFVGGAAASAVHTAVKLAPLYPNVHYCADASSAAVKAKKYMADPEAFIKEETEEHRRLTSLRKEASMAVRKPVTDIPSEGFLHENIFQDEALSSLGWEALENDFDWRMFLGICGVKGSCEESEEARAIKGEALALLGKEKPRAIVCAKFLECRREGDDIVSKDGRFRLPMLRGTSSMADFYPADGLSPLGLFAVKVDCPGEMDIVEHALRVSLAEAASAHLQKKWKACLPEEMKLIAPGIGYSCCPDHSLKRDVLGFLPEGIGISLTESCAMLPEASICGLVIAHRDAAYNDIREVPASALEDYSARRRFSPEEKEVFLGHLMSGGATGSL